MDCTELLNSLHTLSCTTGHVLEYVSKWRTGISCLQSARFVFNVKICINYFIRGLPLISAFTNLHATLPDRLAGATESDLGPFITLTENFLELDTIFCSISQSKGPHPGHPSVQNTLAQTSTLSSSAALSPAVGDPAPRPSKLVLTCGNCKSRGLCCTGHTDSTCFQPGGGMEGHREEYLNNKGHFHALFVESLDNAFISLDTPTVSLLTPLLCYLPLYLLPLMMM